MRGSWFIVVVLFMAGTASAAMEQQRRDFLDAEKAFRRGDTQTYQRLINRLQDYPLLPYLKYDELISELDQRSTPEIQRFIVAYHDSPLAKRVESQWLDHLAKRKRWRDYLAFYRDAKGTRHVCNRLNALIHTGSKSQALAEVKPIWLHGKSQPDACDPVFDAWKRAGRLTDDLIWQRIELAMKAGEWRLARYLGRSLPDTDQAWVERWARLHRNPKRLSASDSFVDHEYREKILAHAVRRLARWEALDALALWLDLKPKYPFDADTIAETERYLGLTLGRNESPLAYEFIKQLPVAQGDRRAHANRIRAAMLRLDWPTVVEWLAALPPSVKGTERWRYWHARGLRETGHEAAGLTILNDLAGERSYYGFLAADIVGAPYNLTHAVAPVSADEVDTVGNMAGIARAIELYALERRLDARREWYLATREMDDQHLKAAAKLAQQSNWHDQAIFTLARTGFWEDLELRFPLEHMDLVDQQASEHNIDRAWIFAVMRQESAFMEDARSPVGARGLMQLMPATAREVARYLKRKTPGKLALLNPDTNIALGSAYLKQLSEKLDGNTVLATAAYNAGPHRVKKWLPDTRLPADVWVELVPFKETRGYLRRVLAYTVIYQKRLNEEPIRISKRMIAIQPDTKS